MKQKNFDKCMFACLVLFSFIVSGCASSVQVSEQTDVIEPYGLTDINTRQGFLSTGIGNQNQVLMQVVLTRNLEKTALPLHGVSVQLAGNTQPKELSLLKVYATETPFFYGDKQQYARLLASAAIPAKNEELNLLFDQPYTPIGKENYLWLVADIAQSAVAGHTIDLAVSHLIVDKKENRLVRYAIASPNPAGETVVYPKQQMLFSPWDAGSEFYRIPAMIVLHSEKKGKQGRILTVTDRRYRYNWDLPNHIDLVARFSDDNGTNWSTPSVIAGLYNDRIDNQGPDFGYGDAALVETVSGKVVCMMAADHQYQSSTAQEPIRMFMGESNDGGDTWEKPKEITSQLYNAVFGGAPSPLQGVFVTSGKGLCLSKQQGDNARYNGRILFAMVCKFESGPYQNYILYSDDEGAHWKVSANSAYVGGDEAKLIEENDGTVVLSTRRSGERGFNRSTDAGTTWGEQTVDPQIWGTSCNADLLVYNDSVYIHSILNAPDRRNLTLYLSTDKGKTWPYEMVVNTLPAAYSTMVKCADGDIGLYFEDGTMSDHYSMNFLKFPCEWIMSNKRR